MAEEAEQFAPYWTSMAVDEPYKISGFLSILAPSNTILTNWLDQTNIKDTGTDTVTSKLKFVTVK